MWRLVQHAINFKSLLFRIKGTMSYLINNAIAIYFSISIVLSQILHTYYVKNDPAYKGRLGIGIPFFNKDTVDYKFGYSSAVVVLISSTFVLFSVFNLLPPLGNLTFDKLFFDYALWIFLTIIGIGLISEMTNPSATKILLDLTAVFMICIILYSSTISPNTAIIAMSIGTMTTVVFLVGINWISQFQKDRVKESGYVHVYFNPALYYFGSFGFNLVVGVTLTVAALLSNS